MLVTGIRFFFFCFRLLFYNLIAVLYWNKYGQISREDTQQVCLKLCPMMGGCRLDMWRRQHSRHWSFTSPWFSASAKYTPIFRAVNFLVRSQASLSSKKPLTQYSWIFRLPKSSMMATRICVDFYDGNWLLPASPTSLSRRSWFPPSSFDFCGRRFLEFFCACTVGLMWLHSLG